MSWICLAVLSEDVGSKNLSLALYDEITMTFQFAIDAVQELDERLGERETG